MNELRVFENQSFGELRVTEIEGKIYYCGKDVAKSLGYSNHRDALNRHCKGVVKRDTLTSGGIQELSFIPEGDVYRLITHSKLPKAQEFESWVFDEVLPTIRKTGGYHLPMTYKEALIDLVKQVEVNEQLQLENKELKPKAEYYDCILQSVDLITTTQIAKDYGMSATKFNTLLHDLEIQYKKNGQWVLYSKYQDQGYTSSATAKYKHTDKSDGSSMFSKWTQKGRMFLYDYLKENDIVPLIEKEQHKELMFG